MNAQTRLTFKSRFSFLATSFVADFQHCAGGINLGPKVTTTASRQDCFVFEPVQLHPSDWVHYLPTTPSNIVFQARDASNGPDVYIVLRELKAEIPHNNLLCFQAKHGEQDLSLGKVLDELAKCPQVSVTSKGHGKRLLAYNNVFKRADGNFEHFQLTFVYAAMNHDKAVKRLLKQGHCEEQHNEYLRCTHESFDAIPEHVELIVLLKPGLIDLLGRDMYSYLKVPKPVSTISSNLADVYHNPAMEILQFKDSEDSSEVIGELSRIARLYKHFTIDLSGIKLVRRPRATSSGAHSEQSNVFPEDISLISSRVENVAHPATRKSDESDTSVDTAISLDSDNSVEKVQNNNTNVTSNRNTGANAAVNIAASSATNQRNIVGTNNNNKIDVVPTESNNEGKSEVGAQRQQIIPSPRVKFEKGSNVKPMTNETQKQGRTVEVPQHVPSQPRNKYAHVKSRYMQVKTSPAVEPKTSQQLANTNKKTEGTSLSSKNNKTTTGSTSINNNNAR